MRLGCLVPPPVWEGNLRGVFACALSILHPDGYIVSILDEGAPMEALALWLDGVSFARLHAAALAAPAAAPVRWLSGRLELAGLSVSLAGAETWDPRPRLEAARLSLALRSAASLDAARRALVALLGAEGIKEGIHGEGAFAQGFAGLMEVEGFPRNLVGFGPGTTPAGDDWLSGWALARTVRGLPTFGPAGLDLARTSPAGRSLLLQVLEGAFPQAQLELAEAIGRGGEGLAPAARALLSHGASSGADTLAGFLAGLDPSA